MIFWGGQKRKLSKIRDANFAKGSILSRLTFFISSYFETEYSSSLEGFAICLPKMSKHDVTKASFSQKIQIFSEVLVTDVEFKPASIQRLSPKLQIWQISTRSYQYLLVKVMIASRRYLPPFLSYCENPAGGRESAPFPQRGAWNT